MSALFSFSIRQPSGEWKKYTGSISDTTDKFGNNLAIYEEQSKEQRDAKEPKKYFANGKVFWTDGKIQVAEKKQASPANNNVENMPYEDLPF